METPDSTVLSFIGETVYTFDDAASSGGPQFLSTDSNYTFDVSGHKSGMKIEVSDVEREGLRAAKLGKIDISSQPHEGGSLVSIVTDFKWESSVALLKEAEEHTAVSSRTELLQAAEIFASRKASDERWTRLLAIYSGEKLYEEETERLQTDDFVFHVAKLFLAQTYGSLNDGQCEKGARAVVAVGYKSAPKKTLMALAEWILKEATIHIAPQQDDHEDINSARNGDV